MSRKASGGAAADQLRQALDRLERRGPVPADEFLAVFRDPAAVRELSARMQAHGVFEPPPEVRPEDLPAMSFPFEDLALFAEDRLSDPGKALAVEDFLRRHARELWQELTVEETAIEDRASEQTVIEERPRKPRGPTDPKA
jgi:hypothetical protein